MTNPTSNFGWQMPTPTDLVTDLPADFEVFGQAVDTSMADLKGGTTGQILSKATNADMDFTWITNDVGDITAVTVSSPLTGGGTSGSVSVGILSGTTSNLGAVQLSDSTSSTSTTLAATANAVKTSYDLAAAAIPKSTVTTAGDVIYATGSSAVTRLGIGTAGQVLQVNSGATAPEWATATAGGMTLLSTTTLSTTSVTIGSINQTYKNLLVWFQGVGNSSGAGYFRVAFNGNTSNAQCGYKNSSGTAFVNGSGYFFPMGQDAMATNYGASSAMVINDYTSTQLKAITSCGNGFNSTSQGPTFASGSYSNSEAITSLVLTTSNAGTLIGTVLIYGVK